jgi:hypothetical protein
MKRFEIIKLFPCKWEIKIGDQLTPYLNNPNEYYINARTGVMLDVKHPEKHPHLFKDITEGSDDNEPMIHLFNQDVLETLSEGIYILLDKDKKPFLVEMLNTTMVMQFQIEKVGRLNCYNCKTLFTTRYRATAGFEWVVREDWYINRHKKETLTLYCVNINDLIKAI